MLSKCRTWCQRQIGRRMLRPSPLEKLTTVDEFGKKFPEFSGHVKSLKTQMGNTIYYVHLDYGHEKTIIYSHNNNEGFYLSKMQMLCEELKCNCISYDYSGFGVSAAQFIEENKEDVRKTLSIRDLLFQLKHTYGQISNHNAARTFLTSLVDQDLKEWNQVRFQEIEWLKPVVPESFYDEATFVSDIECIFDYLTNQCGVDSRDVTLFGSQMGAYPSMVLATILQRKNIPINGIVCEDVLPSMLRVDYPFLFEQGSIYDNEWIQAFIRSVDYFNCFDLIDDVTNCPVLFLHESNDPLFVDTLQMYRKSVQVNESTTDSFWLDARESDVIPASVARHGMFVQFLPEDEDEMDRFVPRHSYFHKLKLFLH